jgi:hypothetical protein
MRKSFIGIAIAAFALVTAGSAQAVGVALETGGNILGGNSAGVVVDAGTRTITAAVGDFIEISLTVSNPGADSVESLFTFVNVDLGVVNTANAAAAPILAEGFGGSTLGTLAGYGDQAVGQAPGTLVGLAHGSTSGTSEAAGPDLATVIRFQVVGTGTFQLSQSLSGNSVINGGADAPDLGPGYLVVVPEPGTALLMGLGLAGLAAAGRREA